MWLEDCRIDGLRWETTGYIADVWGGSDPGADLEGAGLMRWINDEVDTSQPWQVAVAEGLRRQLASSTAIRGGSSWRCRSW